MAKKKPTHWQGYRIKTFFRDAYPYLLWPNILMGSHSHQLSCYRKELGTYFKFLPSKVWQLQTQPYCKWWVSKMCRNKSLMWHRERESLARAGWGIFRDAGLCSGGGGHGLYKRVPMWSCLQSGWSSARVCTCRLLPIWLRVARLEIHIVNKHLHIYVSNSRLFFFSFSLKED